MADINWIIGGITGAATVTLAIITWRYARYTKDYVSLTREILEENRQMRLDAQKPDFVVYLRLEKEEIVHTRPKGSVVNLYVDNKGMGPAYHIEFTTDLSFGLSNKRSLDEVRFLHGIHFLSPGEKRKHRLSDEWADRFRDLMQKHLQIAVTYRDSRNESYPDCFPLDFREY